MPVAMLWFGMKMSFQDMLGSFFGRSKMGKMETFCSVIALEMQQPGIGVL